MRILLMISLVATCLVPLVRPRIPGLVISLVCLWLLFAAGFAGISPSSPFPKRVHAADLQGGDFWACCAFVQVQA